MSDAPLKLLALDPEDLAVVSVHLQDAEIRTSDMTFLPRERRFALVADRFDWEGATVEHVNRRRRTALHFEFVTAVRSKGVDMTASEELLTLLAIAFVEGDAPAGAIQLHFAGGGCIRLEVECLEGALKDLGPTWGCAKCPSHADEEL